MSAAHPALAKMFAKNSSCTSIKKTESGKKGGGLASWRDERSSSGERRDENLGTLYAHERGEPACDTSCALSAGQRRLLVHTYSLLIVGRWEQNTKVSTLLNRTSDALPSLAIRRKVPGGADGRPVFQFLRTPHSPRFTRVWVQGVVVAVSPDGSSLILDDSTAPPVEVGPIYRDRR